ncbi:MAG: hypothetical protein PH343_05585 [Nitrospira sp.]|nr:hypothetical protein [Nitrospira sp.]
MANQIRKFRPVSKKQIIACLRWCQNKLNLRDWEIDLYIGTPSGYERAAAWTMAIGEKERYTYTAEVWVDVDYCKEKDEDVLSVVCHEALHILTGGKCGITDGDDEHLAYCLDDILYEKYCRDNDIKMMPYQEK